MKDLIATRNKMVARTDKLLGFEDADSMSGSLQLVFPDYCILAVPLTLAISLTPHSWSIGFYDKVPLNKALEKAPEKPPSSPTKTATRE